LQDCVDYFRRSVSLKHVCSKRRYHPSNEAASHIGEYATVEGVVAKVFTNKTGNTFLNVGATYPNQTFTGWIAACVTGKQIADISATSLILVSFRTKFEGID
jgi:hypothetical protein